MKCILRLILILSLSVPCFAIAQQFPQITIIGEMRKVKHKGELYGNTYLDSIPDKTHLYGMGPVEYLRGEIIILDGKCYKSSVNPDSSIHVEETYNLKAPFFAYSRIAYWKEYRLPKKIRTIPDLEQFLKKLYPSSNQPFMFRLKGRIEEASIHIVNLPAGSTVRSPEDAHKGKVNYELRDEASEILGFFSLTHQTIFTHHDSFLHLHLITDDKTQMGHVDSLLLPKHGMKLYIGWLEKP